MPKDETPVQMLEVGLSEEDGGAIISAAIAAAWEWNNVKQRHEKDGIESCHCMHPLFGMLDDLQKAAHPALQAIGKGVDAISERLEGGE